MLESKIQTEIVRAVRYMFPYTLIYAVPNGGSRNIKEAANLKRQGVLAGVSDLHVIHKGQMIFVEVKSARGTLSKEQREFRDYVEKAGYQYWVVRSANDLVTLLAKQ